MRQPADRGSTTSRLLLLIRHGKAAPKTAGLSDVERILTPDGADDCDRVARLLSQKRLPVGLMLSSPADRALETAHRFASHLNYPISRIQLSTALYTSNSRSTLAGVLRSLPDEATTIVVVGHNPSLSELAAHLAVGFTRTIAKGAAVAIAFDLDSWADLKPHAGRVSFIVTPQPGHSAAAVSVTADR